MQESQKRLQRNIPYVWILTLERNPGAFSTHCTTPSMIDLEKLERL